MPKFDYKFNFDRGDTKNRGKSRLLSARPDITSVDDVLQNDLIVDKAWTVKRPKLKFNFTVSLVFRDPVQARLQGANTNNSIHEDLTFAIKQASRPNPTITYHDINYYNYRTKVATKMDYGTMQLTFYDDVGDIAHNIFEEYLKAVSPIANVRPEHADLLTTHRTGPQNMEHNLNSQRVVSASSVGPLPVGSGGENGLIRYITIRHWFWSMIERRTDGSPVTDSVNGGNINEIQYVDYHFLNPRVVNMTLDEIDMTQSDVNTVMMNFVYDSVFIDSPNVDNTPVSPKVENSTISINDIRGKINDIERTIRRVKRLDTIPDIPVFGTLGNVLPRISSNLLNIPSIKPQVSLNDLPIEIPTFNF